MLRRSIGGRVQQGVYRMHSQFDREVNFTNDNLLVSLVAEEIGAGPLNIVIKDINISVVSHFVIEPYSVVLEKQ
ncbi:hypothetical protein NKDENANG_00639 [Candidatus Entotheonellaceae bacterium PAL068K]